MIFVLFFIVNARSYRFYSLNFGESPPFSSAWFWHGVVSAPTINGIQPSCQENHFTLAADPWSNIEFWTLFRAFSASISLCAILHNLRFFILHYFIQYFFNCFNESTSMAGPYISPIAFTKAISLTNNPRPLMLQYNG